MKAQILEDSVFTSATIGRPGGQTGCGQEERDL